MSSGAEAEQNYDDAVMDEYLARGLWVVHQLDEEQQYKAALFALGAACVAFIVIAGLVAAL